MIPTVSTLRAARRCLARRVGRIEKAEAVLAEMRAGALLHCQHTKQGPCWALTNGCEVTNAIAKLVVASSSVVGDGALFAAGTSQQQTYRWWKKTEPVP